MSQVPEGRPSSHLHGAAPHDPKSSVRSTRGVGSFCTSLIVGRPGWRRKNGRTRIAVLSLLHFHVGKQHGRCGCGYRNAAGFGSANAVEDAGGVSGGRDLGKHGKWGANDIDTSGQIIRSE